MSESIPPQIDAKSGLFENQILIEREIFSHIGISNTSHILDIGCGRGRIAHHCAKHTGAHVSGFNIDEAQIKNAKE